MSTPNLVNTGKQYSYRKLINERSNVAKAKPDRPPPPHLINGGTNESLLIDISPQDTPVLRNPQPTSQPVRGSCRSLMDEPIDVPQDGKFSFLLLLGPIFFS